MSFRKASLLGSRLVSFQELQGPIVEAIFLAFRELPQPCPGAFVRNKGSEFAQGRTPVPRRLGRNRARGNRFVRFGRNRAKGNRSVRLGSFRRSLGSLRRLDLDTSFAELGLDTVAVLDIDPDKTSDSPNRSIESRLWGRLLLENKDTIALRNSPAVQMTASRGRKRAFSPQSPRALNFRRLQIRLY